mmetsp:Transcript_12649/g.24321  ORF Transcript_12649/g.24321 Transcript_12649/m.24321 type:complete len:85 (-) Transcript_12649:56-310(-)
MTLSVSGSKAIYTIRYKEPLHNATQKQDSATTVTYHAHQKECLASVLKSSSCQQVCSKKSGCVFEPKDEVAVQSIHRILVSWLT